MLCSVVGCGLEMKAKGLCSRHYKNAWNKAHYQANKEDILAKIKAHRDANPEKVRAGKRAYRAKNRAKLNEDGRTKYAASRRARRRLINSFMSEACFLALRVQQQGKCAICTVELTPSGPTKECADHCHETQKPRRLLCTICNTALGFYEKHQRAAGLRIEAYEAYLSLPEPSGF